MIRYWSWFAGCGGDAEGVKRNPHIRLTGAVEWWEVAAESYKRNHGDHVAVLDIRTVSWRQLVSMFGRPDHIHFSPPCQDFSISGYQAGWDGERGGLMWQPIRLLSEAALAGELPLSIDMENVKGLVSSKHRSAFGEWLLAVESLGYKAEWQVVNMANYGIAQTRERVIFGGSLNGELHLPAPTHAKSAWVTGAQALGVDGSVPYLWEDDVYNKPSRDAKPRVYDLSVRPAPTVDARTGGRPKLGQPGGTRRGTHVEWATFQSFPNGYVFCGAESQRAMQIGNACPPLFYERLAEEIVRAHSVKEREAA